MEQWRHAKSTVRARHQLSILPNRQYCDYCRIVEKVQRRTYYRCDKCKLNLYFNRSSGRVAHGTKPGPRPYLSTEEETELGTFLKNCASVGYGKTRKDVLLIAESVAKEKDILKKECITSGWWNKFLKRQGDLSTISKYLVCPANTTPSGIGRKSLPRARLLTSAESLAMFEEKEKKQQDEKEQKEKRKKEREEKKKQREVDMKRKAEERAKKAEEQVKKAEVKAQKAAEQKEKKQGVKRKCRGTKLGSISLKEEQSQ